MPGRLQLDSMTYAGGPSCKDFLEVGPFSVQIAIRHTGVFPLNESDQF